MTGEVYFIQGETTKRVKIGYSFCAPVRLQELQVGSPDKLKLLGVLNGGPSEVKLHKAQKAFRSHGEWFDENPALMAFIRKQAVPHAPCGNCNPKKLEQLT